LSEKAWWRRWSATQETTLPGERDPQRTRGLEGAVGEVAVQPDGHSEAADHVEAHEEADVHPAESPAPGERNRGDERERRDRHESDDEDLLEHRALSGGDRGGGGRGRTFVGDCGHA
jgi:hypothetical protein